VILSTGWMLIKAEKEEFTNIYQQPKFSLWIEGPAAVILHVSASLE
jgi:hypothetical protein